MIFVFCASQVRRGGMIVPWARSASVALHASRIALPCWQSNCVLIPQLFLFDLLRRFGGGGIRRIFCCFQCQNTLIIRLIKRYSLQLLHYSPTTRRDTFRDTKRGVKEGPPPERPCGEECGGLVPHACMLFSARRSVVRIWNPSTRNSDRRVVAFLNAGPLILGAGRGYR